MRFSAIDWCEHATSRDNALTIVREFSAQAHVLHKIWWRLMTTKQRILKNLGKNYGYRLVERSFKIWTHTNSSQAIATGPFFPTDITIVEFALNRKNRIRYGRFRCGSARRIDWMASKRYRSLSAFSFHLIAKHSFQRVHWRIPSKVLRISWARRMQSRLCLCSSISTFGIYWKVLLYLGRTSR